MKTVFIAWERHHARTALLGRALGAEVHFIARVGRVRGLRLLLKYLWQSVDTLRVLLREQPGVVLVQTPPVFPALWATLYAALRPGTRVLLDAHSGTFLSPKWRWSLSLQRWCARRAAMTIVHMPSLLPVVQSWGAPAMEMGYAFEPEPPRAGAYPLPAGTSLAVPCSFNADEPVEIVFQAAARLPRAHFYLTGDPRRLPPALAAHRPDNVHLTGYLGLAEYFGLLGSADAVLALTTQDQTFQTGGAEAVWLGRPLIMSDWPELRQVFARGTLFVTHDAESLAAAVESVAARGPALAREMRALKSEFDAERQAKVRRLLGVMGDDAERARPVREWMVNEER